jgi:formylglycine-generating enzyme required for sulfatase activity
LLRQVASSTEQVIDESATVDWIAQTDLWMPQLQPALEPWLELALVIDESESMILWRHAVNELQRVLKHYGMFRDVRVWGMGRDGAKQIYLRSQTRFHSPKELIDPQNRRLIVVVSDVTDDLWREAQMLSILREWTASNPVAILQMLPAWMWSRTALRLATPAQFRSTGHSILNPHLKVEVNRLAKRRSLDKGGINLPAITLEPERAKSWSQMLAGQGDARTSGYVLREDLLAASTAAKSAETPTAQERVSDFTSNASPLAQRLAGLLAAAPMITMPVVRLIQDSIGANADAVRTNADAVGANADAVGANADAVGANADTERANSHSPLLTFTFQTVTVNRKGEIINTDTKTAQYFTEDLALRQAQGSALDMIYIPGGTFWMGTEDEEIERLSKKYKVDYLRRERPQHKVTVQPFFMGKYPITQGQWKAVANMTHLKVNRDLDPEPSEFKDDPPKSSLKRGTSESSFEQEAGEETFTRWDRPVEQVSWYDAVEFCQRLSQLTGQDYRLPTEAEWEYACRAVTSDRSENLPLPPFHFGETLTDKLANYRANSIYAEEPKGEERRETTAVGHFSPNAFGLYDMHGNVYEWCEDDYRDSYVDASTDGSAWRSGNKSTTKVIRGGCWHFSPYFCRCAYRGYYSPDVSKSSLGFRVVRAAW